MKVKLQPPSASDLPAFNPILPPAAITQVMLIANPRKVSTNSDLTHVSQIRSSFAIVYISLTFS